MVAVTQGGGVMPPVSTNPRPPLTPSDSPVIAGAIYFQTFRVENTRYIVYMFTGTKSTHPFRVAKNGVLMCKDGEPIQWSLGEITGLSKIAEPEVDL